jgi:hypothetical protein
MCELLVDSIEQALIQLRYAMADYYSCRDPDCTRVFSILEAPLCHLREGASSTQFAIDRLRATWQTGLVDIFSSNLS